MLTNIIDTDAGALCIDMPLQVTFRRTEEGRDAPVFVIAS
jgi:hypothetical protein